MDQEIQAYVKEHTKDYDEGHGYGHALSVYNQAMTLGELECPTADREILGAAALMHDVSDHNIASVSFSKEKAGLTAKLSPEDSLIRTIIADADRLEAIGRVGLRRCIQYELKLHPGEPMDKVVQQVVQHSHDKLLRLYPEKYIKTASARKIAAVLHDETMALVTQLSTGTKSEVEALVTALLA